jgi:hypothetical protein
MRGEDLVEDFGQVLEQMKTVGHLIASDAPWRAPSA